jgi:hypothetical protein
VGPSAAHMAEVLLELADPHATPATTRLFFVDVANHANAALLLEALYDCCEDVQVRPARLPACLPAFQDAAA